jgi:Spy/CpxP family protein refolding chaperone
MMMGLIIDLITKEKQMRLTIRFAVVGLVLMLAQGVVRAQGFGAFRTNPVMLLSQESVTKELKLTDEQTTKLNELRQKTRDKMQDIFQGDEADRPKKMQELTEENRKEVAGILNADQSKRLKEITLQLRGPAAFADPEVVKTLNLTEEQQGKVKTINEETQAATRELFTPGQPPDEETRKKMNDVRKGGTDKLVALLTPEQKTQWTAICGEPFKGEIRFGPPRQQ